MARKQKALEHYLNSAKGAGVSGVALSLRTRIWDVD